MPRRSSCILVGSLLLLSSGGGWSGKPTTEQEPTVAAQLLQQPLLWLGYSAEERFAMYNSLYYNLLQDSGGASSRLSVWSSWSVWLSGKAPAPTGALAVQQLDDIFLWYIDNYPEDPYNSYYLYNIAGHYIRRGEQQLGLWLLHTQHERFPDLQWSQYPSLRYLMLDAIGRMATDVDQRLTAIEQILAQYAQTDSQRSVWLYRLGAACERKATQLLYLDPGAANEQLQAAMQAYSEFLRLDSDIADYADEQEREKNVRDLVTNKIQIYNAKRRWYTDPSLDSLIGKIQSAIQTRNVALVLYYQANDFFVLSADYRDEIKRRDNNIYLPHFLGGAVQFGNLTPESNGEEAWLYSTNWPFHLTTWYLYFRKIHYPADPALDGHWEWSGIYLGDFY